MSFGRDFDVVVIGGGHAGCEAAHASARMGARTALVSLSRDRIGVMSCNPAMGGLAKGQLVKEIDALGGIMGIQTDKTAIQYRRLNSSKGPAVRSSRAQCDKVLYATSMQECLETVPNLTILESEVSALNIDGQRISGITLSDGVNVSARAVVVTTGTFLRALMHTGFEQKEGGRLGDGVAKSLSGSLEKLGFRLRRLKTGTPPRLHRHSIDWTRLEPQPGDIVPLPFSFYYRPAKFPVLPQIQCHITYTNARTHELIAANFDRSPMFTGVIQGVGPRYCPSIEDKVKRFADKDRHQIFLEPESLSTDEIYVNGVSTSLPAEVQEKFIRTIDGLERAEFTKFGYAVEYDAVDARQLKRTLESKDVDGLFLAGQVNGTSGYEEAGAQGLVAGINAACQILDRDSLVLGREEGYIGVLVDDLTTKGADEPYRMFTSRAEYRLLLREDNADLRLAHHGHRVGLLDRRLYEQVESKRSRIAAHRARLAETWVLPTQATNDYLASKNSSGLKDRSAADVLLRRPELSTSELAELGVDWQGDGQDVLEQVEIETKYEGYIRRDLQHLEGLRRDEGARIPGQFDYDRVPGLSNEVRARLKEARPETLGQASRIFGVTPAAVANLVIFLKMRKNGAESYVG